MSGHPESELALIELYRTTGDKNYLDLAGYISRGDPERIALRPDRYSYMFSGIPFASRTKLESHAVRAMYACNGATDYYLETGDPAYWKTLETLWKDLTASKMYITGGVGARGAGEALGDPYELPNLRAYGESCAAIGNMMWNSRMLFRARADRSEVGLELLDRPVSEAPPASGQQHRILISCYSEQSKKWGRKFTLSWDSSAALLVHTPERRDMQRRRSGTLTGELLAEPHSPHAD